MSHAPRRSRQENLQRTVLAPFHEKHGAKMVPFAGFSMPLEYSVGQGAAQSTFRFRRGQC